MKKKIYIQPIVRPIDIEHVLLETISGENQGGVDLGEAKQYDDFIFDDYNL